MSPVVPASRRCTIPGLNGSPTAAISGYNVKKAIDEGAGRIARSRVNNQTLLLVDHDDVVVGVHDVHPHRSVTTWSFLFGQQRGVDGDRLALFELHLARHGRFTVDGDAPAGNERR